ncbi:MAG TPA: hypothetical protein DCG47_04255 [Spirochaetaceae bacterium]|nr:hypothetical protein [Spirochaetaceae bacterium]
MTSNQTRCARITALAVSAVFVLTALASFSCVSSSGSGYERSVDDDQSAAARAAAAKKDKTPPPQNDTDGSTNPPNSSWSGSGSWSSSGSSSISIQIQAATPRGTIELRGAPTGATLLIDGVPRSSAVRALDASGTVARTETEAGYRRVRMELFGYEAWESVIELPARGYVLLYASMPRLPFTLVPASEALVRSDPRRPGSLGTARIAFKAQAPGSARVWIENQSGRLLRDIGRLAITGEAVLVDWDGKDEQGLVLPNGLYRIRIQGEGGEASGSAGASRLVELPRLEPLRAASLHGAYSGALLAPDSIVLPRGVNQVSGGAYAYIDARDSDGAAPGGTMSARIPSWFGLRLGGLPFEGSELVVSIMATPYLGYDFVYDPSGFSLLASLKGELLRAGDFSAAFLARAGIGSFLDDELEDWPASWDGAARFPGAGGGFVLEYAPGPGRIFLSAEAIAARFYPEWGDQSGVWWEVPGFFAWAYLRGGVETLIELGAAGQLSAMASIAARSWPFGGPAGFQPPLSVAGELAWYAPSSPFVLHAYAAGQWERFYSWYFGGGLGLSLLF